MQTSVEAIASRLVDQFGVEMNIYQVSENCMEALNLMGMLKLSKRAIAGCIKDQQFRMPVDCVDVKAVYGLPNPRKLGSVTLTIQDIAFPPQVFFLPVPNSEEDMLETKELTDSVLNYIPHFTGPYVDFNWDPPFLKFNECDGMHVVAVYNRIPINRSTLLCEIPQDAFAGCLNYCLYVYFQPLFLTGKIPKYVFDEVKDWKRIKMGQSITAVMMSKLSQNEMSKVHSVMSSFDRKRTNIDS